jgi:hypothetical protein
MNAALLSRIFTQRAESAQQLEVSENELTRTKAELASANQEGRALEKKLKALQVWSQL